MLNTWINAETISVVVSSIQTILRRSTLHFILFLQFNKSNVEVYRFMSCIVNAVYLTVEISGSGFRFLCIFVDIVWNFSVRLVNCMAADRIADWCRARYVRCYNIESKHAMPHSLLFYFYLIRLHFQRLKCAYFHTAGIGMVFLRPIPRYFSSNLHKKKTLPDHHRSNETHARHTRYEDGARHEMEIETI